MTDEEMARLFIINKYDLRKDLEIWAIKNNCELSKEYYAYIAGLKAGKDMAETDLATVAYMQGAERYKPKWHKVADGDLPKETEFIESDVLLLLVQLRGTKHKRYELGRYNFSGNVFCYTHLKLIEDVVAWCEIPKYTEE